MEDSLEIKKKDRRLLNHVPDALGIRSNQDRRQQRYEVNYDVKVGSIDAKITDISTSGCLIISEKDLPEKTKLTFEITPGSMPEGYEMKIKKIPATLVRHQNNEYGYQFDQSLAEFVVNRRHNYMITMASVFIAVVVFIIILMRAESVIFFKFNKWLYLYSIMAATFLLTRYLFGALYKPVKIDPEYTPSVSIIVPCFNEQEWIERTILSCINQDYPVDKLEVIVVDDKSNDNSLEKIKETVSKLQNFDGEHYQLLNRIQYIAQPKNMGKREAMAVGAQASKHELLVFVDSDSFLDPYAVRNIIQPFKDEKMGGVSGRTDVANTYTNSLTKMQSVRYYIAFRVFKAAESYFDTVSCLSGPLSCYRKDLVLKYMDEWLNQKFLRHKATFGDDRSMTNFILRHNRTCYQDTAICSTIVPNDNKVFLKQQMRWKRSWLRESFIASTFMWKKEPFAALSFYAGLLVPIIAPIIVIYNLIYIPIIHRVFPTTFIFGMFMMAMLMSFAQLFFRKSTTWLFGLWFCVYYEFVLLWQMPFAWISFWKAEWGTRNTDADIEAKKKKEAKKLAVE